MQIRNMFAKDINRAINGVIKVDQDADAVIGQEVDEYVITRELKKHFMTFFDFYSESFETPTDDIGIWISGFFGSGKSHFLKMLSYILENKVVEGIPTVERFREKFADDPATFMMIDNSAKHETETILFNIDVEGSINKDKTAVLRVFAKMFYKHLGYYGENLKVAMLEQYIDEMGKTEEFRRVFEEKNGKPWLEQRKAFAFNGKSVIPTLMEVLDMSEEDAKNWFNSKDSVEFSIADLVDDIKTYVNSKPKDFRLIFMADEVGQYVGTDTDMLLNLQSIAEKIGSECNGKVWIACTGQEAIDEIIKVRADEFSRIQARFKTRLSLSSSSVDEVIQKRILKKTPEAEKRLETVYNTNEVTLHNLFTFKDSIMDIKGYESTNEYLVNYPFVPYQFIIMQKVFAEIRKHGNSGKHLSGGERSMLSGFQEAVQAIQDRNETALVPFYLFYDTVHTFLDGSIRRVIERCERAADSNAGITEEDVKTLKLLYLIRYVDDIPANLDNIVVLLADNIEADKINMRTEVQSSLDRLLKQSYIGRTGNIYTFLTDEEQDVAREIRNTQVDTSEIVDSLARKIFGDIYTSKKFHYGVYNFPLNQMVDGRTIGNPIKAMSLHFMTVASDPAEKIEFRLLATSDDKVIVVLPDSSPYYESLENAMKIRKYVKQRNVSQLPKTMQDTISDQQEEASAYEASALETLKKGIEDATFYVAGQKIPIRGGDAKSKIDQALEYLVSHVYSKLDLIGKNYSSDAEIIDILNGNTQAIDGTNPNSDAIDMVYSYLVDQDAQHLPTSMADIQSRYQAIPYGWREIDIAAVVADLIALQKADVKHCGETIQSNDPKLPDFLRKKSETGKTNISKHISTSEELLHEATEFLREYFDIMDVPRDEDKLVAYIVDKFTEQRDHYNNLLDRYRNRKYPDQDVVEKGIQLMDDVLSQQKDHVALVGRLDECKDELRENKEKMQFLEEFFKNQVKVFDAASTMVEDFENDNDYLSSEPEASEALNEIRSICLVSNDVKFDYKRIPELNGLMNTVNLGHDKLLLDKREELMECVEECIEEIHSNDCDNAQVKDAIQEADKYYANQKQKIADLSALALLDSLVLPLSKKKDETIEKIGKVLSPPVTPTATDQRPPKKYKPINRSIVFPSRQLESIEDINSYLKSLKEILEKQLQNSNDFDGIVLK